MDGKGKTIWIKTAEYLWGVPFILLVGTVLITNEHVPSDVLEHQWTWLYCSGLMCLAVSGCGLLAVSRAKPLHLAPTASWIMAGFGGIEAILGLCQIAGIYPSRHSLFILTGTFYNPGPYSGYLAAILPVTLHLALQARKRTDTPSRIRYYAAIGAAMLIICVLPAGMSRAAWLAAFLSSAYVLARHSDTKLKNYILSHRKAMSVCLLIGVLAATGAYLMKKDSADGRLFIWKVTSTAIWQKPLEGYPEKTFSAVYGDAQESYFAKGNYSETEARVAGSPDFAFNEYLQIAVKKGVVYMVLFLALSFFALHEANKSTSLFGLGGTLVSLMTFACFSYPLSIPGLVAIWFTAGGILFIEGLRRTSGKFFKTCIFLIMALGIWKSITEINIHIKREEAATEWMKSRMFYHSGAYQTATETYKKLYHAMEWNADFCFEYGRALYKTHHTKEAQEVLTKALNISGDPMILNLLGRNAHEGGRHEAAEQYLIRSTHRVPDRIYPYYLLVKLYADPAFHQADKMQKAAEKVLHKKPKIPSPAIEEMRREVHEILRKHTVTK